MAFRVPDDIRSAGSPRLDAGAPRLTQPFVRVPNLDGPRGGGAVHPALPGPALHAGLEPYLRPEVRDDHPRRPASRDSFRDRLALDFGGGLRPRLSDPATPAFLGENEGPGWRRGGNRDRVRQPTQHPPIARVPRQGPRG